MISVDSVELNYYLRRQSSVFNLNWTIRLNRTLIRLPLHTGNTLRNYSFPNRKTIVGWTPEIITAKVFKLMGDANISDKKWAYIWMCWSKH